MLSPKRNPQEARSYRLFKNFLVLLLAICLILPGKPIPLMAAQNPSREEIAQIFERVAQEKQVPAEILKAIAYTESGWRQWDSNGNVVANNAGRPPYLGIMQVGTYNPANTKLVNNLKNDIAVNIAYGADALLSKWDMTPRIGDGDKSKLENWYFAIWAYNSWSTRNNPNNAAAAGRVAYQDKILKLMATEFYKGVTAPVQVTPVPRSLLPSGTVPSKSVNWQTPEPIHYSGFSTAEPPLSSEDEALLAGVPRIAGTDRIDTALKIAATGWPEGCETVVLVKSGDFPDALAGVALARKHNAPILLTPQDSLDNRVEEALLNLKPQKVIILGGESAVSSQVESRLREVLTSPDNIQRIARRDRFETAALIAAEFPLESGIALSTGYNFPDALSLATAAAAQGYPLLLVGKDNLPQATSDILQRMTPRTMYVAGGKGAVSPGTIERIKDLTGLTLKQITRFAGQDRFETSALILKQLYPETHKIFLATGQNFPDALAGAALAANTNTPMLLVALDGPAAGSLTEEYLKTLPEDLEVEVFGGETAVTNQSILKVKKR
jgi:putative cell wall-binding protein